MHREFGLSDERLRNRMLQHEYDFARSSSTPLHSAATKASNLGFCLLMLALNNSGKQKSNHLRVKSLSTGNSDAGVAGFLLDIFVRKNAVETTDSESPKNAIDEALRVKPW